MSWSFLDVGSGSLGGFGVFTWHFERFSSVDFGVNFQDPDSSALPHVQETPKPEVALDASQISFSFSDPGAMSGWKSVQGKAKNYLFQVSMVKSKTPLPLSKNLAIWGCFPFTIIGEISQRSRNHFFKIYL